ncbi:hypothetical protein ACIRU3_15645 [Streptomyces sp. NPDC101151]|uniref:hypothetical protein n=1 Tax=Streptomyces sp. NPDC101151 TaxID=3366115 RepID=UPI003802F52B
MGWEQTDERRGNSRLTWAAADLSAAAALSGAQVPAAGLLVWIQSFSRDNYGVGNGGALGALCFLVFAPLLLPVLGMAQTFVLTLPSVVLARLAGRRLRGPSWLWHLVAPVVPALVLGGLSALLWSWPLTTTVAVSAALGVLPTLGVGYVRRRTWRPWGVWWRAALGSVALFVLAFGGGVLATETGLIAEYEPPKLTTAQLAGEWHGPHGAVLRLHPGGRAEAIGLPAQPPDYDWLRKEFVRCDGVGSWKPEDGEDSGGRDGILLRLEGDCGEDTHWSFGGTTDAPELFVLFGDPDGGTLRILHRGA